jgi:hypothetical protein
VSLPSRIGRYAVRRRIGSGGFATVWLGYDDQLDSPVAIKVLGDNWTDDHHVKQRFVDEGRFLRRVESPHVVPVYDAGELDDGRPYLVMAYADQGTLADRLEAGGLEREEALEVVRQVGLGLSALHQHQVLHRDVKPANVLFRTVEGTGPPPQVRAMVGDLGLGKTADLSSRLTMIAGTPTFVAPEQAQGERLDPRVDQYSLAAIAYLLLAGRPPHRHASMAAAARPGEPDPMSTPDWPVPAEVEYVVRRGLAPDREDRWPDVASFTAALAGAAGERAAVPSRPPRVLPLDPERTQPGARPSPRTGQPPLGPPTPPPHRRRRAVLVAIAAVILLVAGGVVGYLSWAQADGTTTLSDSRSTLSVTVPDDWDRAAATDGWQPPDADATYPALSVGTTPDWESADGQGVFVGILPGTELPASVPGHPECASAEAPVDDDRGGDRSVTVYYTDCPDVTVERVVQVAANRLLWIQVRAATRATAVDVLDSVTTHGL